MKRNEDHYLSVHIVSVLPATFVILYLSSIDHAGPNQRSTERNKPQSVERSFSTNLLFSSCTWGLSMVHWVHSWRSLSAVWIARKVIQIKPHCKHNNSSETTHFHVTAPT